MRKFRYLLIIASLLAVLAGMSVHGTAHAQTTSHSNGFVTVPTNITCLAYSCDNTDPVITGCAADQQTAATAPLAFPTGQQIGEVDIMYSPTCDTNWAYVWLYGQNSPDTYLSAQTCQPDNITGSCTDVMDSNSLDNNPNDIWSNQMYAPTSICATAYGNFFDWNAETMASGSAQAC